MLVLLILGAYLLGSIPVGVLVGRAFGFDPRATGSGNIGMTNVARSGGKTAAALTFGGDLLKGLIPVAAIRRQGFPPLVLAMVGFAAFVGSITSIFLLFKGGRGVSTSVGVWLGLAPLPIGISILVFLVMLATTRIVSRSEEHTSELQSRLHLVCRLLLEKKKTNITSTTTTTDTDPIRHT